MKKYDVFISYCRDDKILAMTICHVLKKAGISYWYDEEAIGSGEIFTDDIAKGLLSSRIVILISSQSSENSSFVEREIALALRSGIDIIPYKTDNYVYEKKIKKLTSNINYINAVARPYDEFDSLISGVYRKLEILDLEQINNDLNYIEKDIEISCRQQIFEFTYDKDTKAKLKNNTKPIGILSFAILVLESIVLSLLFTLFINRWFVLLLVLCLITAIIFPILQRNKCTYTKCQKKADGKYKFIHPTKNKSKYFNLCSEHKHTIDYYNDKEGGMYSNLLTILIVTAILIFTMISFQINIQKISQAYNEAITFVETENSIFYANEASLAFSATDSNTLSILPDGSVSAFDTTKYKNLDKLHNIMQISASNTHMIAIDYDYNIYLDGQNTDGQLNINTFGNQALLIEAGDGFSFVVTNEHKVMGFGRNDMGQLDFNDIEGVARISAGKDHAIALLEDGTAIAKGSNSYSQCEVNTWHDLIAVSAGANLSVGLKNNGTVVSTIGNLDWTDIVMVRAGDGLIVGLSKDKRVYVAGDNNSLSKEIARWRNIISIDISAGHIVGLKSDYRLIDVSIDGHSYTDSGQEIGAGLNNQSMIEENSRNLSLNENYGVYLNNGSLEIIGDAPKFLLVGFDSLNEIRSNNDTLIGLKGDGTLVLSTVGSAFDIYEWSDVKTVDMCDTHVVAVKNDGTVIAEGENTYGQCNVDEYKDIKAVSVYNNSTILLRNNGSSVILGESSGYSFRENNITAIDVSPNHIAALLSDGRVVAVGNNDLGQCETRGWTNIVQIATGEKFTLGLKNDGTVVVTGAIDLTEYGLVNDIKSIMAYKNTFVLQKSDGGFIYSFN